MLIYEIITYMKCFYKRTIILLLLTILYSSIFAQDLTPGLKLFMQNQPVKAIPVLESELRGANPSPELYNYLGIAYSQTGDFEKAVNAFNRGLSVIGTNKKILYYNQGNAYYKLQNYIKACDCYSMTLTADPDFSEPYLNRANAYLKLNKLDESIQDYEKYLELSPNDPQEEEIKKLLVLLRKEKDIQIAENKRKEEENLRLMEEEERLNKARQEQERIAAQKRAEEEERRRRLLEDVANSLKQSSDTVNMSAGAENVLNYDDESEID